MMSKKKVCLITPNHISSNPRLVKEAIALECNGYNVHIVFCQTIEYLVVEDYKILDEHPQWTYSVLFENKVGIANKIKFKLKSIVQKVSQKLLKYNQHKLLLGLAVNRNFLWQFRISKSISADLYIAHNIGALPVAGTAAAIQKKLYCFDAEDYHRGEFKKNSQESVCSKLVEDKYLKNCKFITTASPLIEQIYKDLYPSLNFKCVNNVFLKSDFKNHITINMDSPLKLVWFSQTVGNDRGIEVIIEALNNINEFSVDFHLFGNCSNGNKIYFEKLLKNKHQLVFEGTKNPKILNEQLSNYDVGLASEIGKDLNNEVALSNKIFSYVQAGLYVLASDTKAQFQFMQNNPNVGAIYPKFDSKEVAKMLIRLHYNRPELIWHKKNSLMLGKTLNWEEEQKKFIHLVNNII
jgi:hypothetical protein